MSPEAITTVMRETIIALLWVSTPIMALALVVGLVIGLLQALTSIQESTLTFVPKIILVFAALMLLFPFMAGQMNTFAMGLFARMANPEAAESGALPTPPEGEEAGSSQ
jgi:flagellar biosynthetic protein FliQ